MTDEQALKDAVVEKSIAYIEVRNRCPSGEHPDGHFAAFSAASKEFISAVEALRSFRTRKDTEMTTPNVTVLQVGATPEEWSVEAIDSDADGGCDVTLFSGPRARQRAERYAHTEYLRTPKAEPDVALLRQALIACGRAAGGFLSDDCSTDFLMHVPLEVEAKIKSLRTTLKIGDRVRATTGRVIGQEGVIRSGYNWRWIVEFADGVTANMFIGDLELVK